VLRGAVAVVPRILSSSVLVSRTDGGGSSRETTQPHPRSGLRL